MKKTSTILIAIFTFSLVNISCKNENAISKIKKENVLKAKERDKIISKGSAVATFNSKEFDFGTIKEGDIVETVFVVKNTGKTDLIITNAKTTCGCTVPQWPKDPIPPGESEEIKVKFDSRGKRGKQSKNITLFTNTENGREVLKLVGFIKTKEVKMPSERKELFKKMLNK